MIQFHAHERRIRFVLQLPKRDSAEVTRTPTGRRRKAALLDEAYEQAGRQRWRALVLCIKAKLEAVASGITEFESEFLAHIVMPDGKTVGEHSRPMIARAYETGQTQKLIPHLE